MCLAALAWVTAGGEESLPRFRRSRAGGGHRPSLPKRRVRFRSGGNGGGSGVVISADGLGLTNFHVVADMLPARRGTGGLADGRKYPLEVIGIDPTGEPGHVSPHRARRVRRCPAG